MQRSDLCCLFEHNHRLIIFASPADALEIPQYRSAEDHLIKRQSKLLFETLSFITSQLAFDVYLLHPIPLIITPRLGCCIEIGEKKELENKDTFLQWRHVNYVGLHFFRDTGRRSNLICGLRCSYSFFVSIFSSQMVFCSFHEPHSFSYSFILLFSCEMISSLIGEP